MTTMQPGITLTPDTKPTVIFDFDGTLADTFVTSIRIFEKVTRKPEPFSDEDIVRLRGMTAYQVVRELKIRPWRLPWLLVRGRALMRREIDSIVVFDGIEDVLKQLAADEIPMYIMSSNSPGNIRKLLQAKGLDGYFIQVYGNVSIFGKAKRLRQIMAANSLDYRHAMYVGDEGRDIEAAKRAGLKSVAVAWGYNSAELLARHHPDNLALTPAELGRILVYTDKYGE
jgi:phosphoglycolate phosphatase